MKPTVVLLFILCAVARALAAEPASPLAGPAGPAGPADFPAPAAPGVLVCPFAPLGDVSTAAWVGRGLQQNLLAELSRLSMLRAIAAPDVGPAPDAAAAQKLAVLFKADYAIIGSFQIGPFGVRITGNVLDVRSGSFISGLKATGTQRDLFALEDTITEQARRILTQQLQPPPPAPAVPPAAQAPPPPAPRYNPMLYTNPQPYYGPDYRQGYYNYMYSPGVPYYSGCWPYGYYPYSVYWR